MYIFKIIQLNIIVIIISHEMPQSTEFILGLLHLRNNSMSVSKVKKSIEVKKIFRDFTA